MNTNETVSSKLTSQREETVGEYLDSQIRNCREHLEGLVILKAKAETAQVLNYPHSFFRAIVYSYPF